jgi:Domain of unknown function (DUF6429)
VIGVTDKRPSWERPSAELKLTAVLALLALGRHDGYRAWKSFDWESMGRLHEKGCITDPVGKAKSVLFTEDGARESARLLKTLFGR